MMPRSAMATGAAGFVEPIDRMVERIAEVARSKEALRRLGTDEADEDLRRILGFLRAASATTSRPTSARPSCAASPGAWR